MGMYIMFLVYGVPCLLFLLWCLTPKGRTWLRQNHMI